MCMKIKWSKVLLLRILLSVHLLLVSPFFVTSFAEAAPGGQGQRGQGQRGQGPSLDQAVSQVQQQTGGRVLRAKQNGGVYVITVLMPSGVVKTFRVNAN